MGNLPKVIKLTHHAQQRLAERKNLNNYYNTKNLMRSSYKWYGKDDLILDSALYKHCLYVCRKSNQIGYITDGNIEVIYNKNTRTAITVLKMKEKFLPITDYIKPKALIQLEMKKDHKKLRSKLNLEYCSTIDGKDLLENNVEGMCHIEEFQEIYTSIVSEIRSYVLNFKNQPTKLILKNEQSHNIVYKKSPTKRPMTISELFDIDNKEKIGSLVK